jgi:hypothetical protein
MMIASMEVLSRLTDADFIKNVLHVQSFLTDEQGSDGVSAIDGENLDPVASGFSASLDYAVYDELWAEYGGLLPSDISDTVFPDNEASALFFDEDTDSVGLRWPGLGKEAPGRLALLTFPLDAVPMDGTPNGRTALLERILSFLMPGASQNATLRFGAAAYQSPGIATIELGDSDLAGLGSLSLTVTNTSNATGVTITMIESAAPGQFGGSVPLTTAPQPPVGSLRALHGEVLQASYLDASASTTRTAATAVDNLPPVISNISGEPDYVDAIIYWDTSEPADSLVLFGDSPLMGRSAYTASLETGHAVVLPSLVPDRVYYYRVFSRDTGGNLAQGQTGTNVYQFRTKTPVSLPWTDGMDDGGTNWSTYTEETVAAPPGASGWTLGPLENGMTTNAHSPPHCWGTNLKGEPLEGMESFLISPAFYLPADRSAALTFWHSYDFYDYSGFDIEFGGIQVSVNNGPLLDVTSYFDSSYGEWEQATVDLTPYAGNMVLIVWHYALLGFEPGPRPGWTVDDVSITSQEYSGGAIRITNNIWQADYVLSGKLSRAGKGPLTISNAPPGQYFLEFAPVPYYFTPSAQTNTLAPGQTLVLVGTYTFADANNNGISDAWETNFFKTIDPARTPSTDSDGDGMSDYAEFVTGTDPTGPDRPFALKSWRTNAGEFTIEWPSIPGETYSVQSAASLANWTLAVPEIQASSTVSRVTVPMTGNRSFFRVAKSQAATNTLPESLRLSPAASASRGARQTAAATRSKAPRTFKTGHPRRHGFAPKREPPPSPFQAPPPPGRTIVSGPSPEPCCSPSTNPTACSRSSPGTTPQTVPSPGSASPPKCIRSDAWTPTRRVSCCCRTSRGSTPGSSTLTAGTLASTGRRSSAFLPPSPCANWLPASSCMEENRFPAKPRFWNPSQPWPGASRPFASEKPFPPAGFHSNWSKAGTARCGA